MKHQRQFPGASPYFDRHKKRRWRFRVKGFTAELGAEYGSDEFIARYEAALTGSRIKGTAGAGRTRPGSLDALVVSFRRSPGWLSLSGLVACLCRSKCSFRPLGVRRPRGFCLPMLNADGAGYRSR
jgi:hypothetical protein